MTCPTALTGGTIVRPDRTLSDGTLTIVGERIESVGTPRRPPSVADTVDVSGHYVMPGLVDIHGDDIERYLFPRPEEQVPAETALRASDRAALAAGVTTKFHALAFEDAPEERRSIEVARQLAETIRLRRSCIDARIHARCELGESASVAAVTDLLSDGDADLVSVMTHTGEGQYDSPDALGNRYEPRGGGDDGGVTEIVRSRAGVSKQTLASRRKAVVAAAERAGVPVASHDDVDADAVDGAAGHGVDICEFPLTMAAARRAAELDLPVVMGAPNLVRGGSLWDNLDARTALDAGLVDVFCSDFRSRTLLQSAFVETGEPLHERVNRVTSAPTSAVGLDDRGRLDPGQRADILVVDPEPTPTVARAFVGGAELYRFDHGG
jgi:alpha-D-ribose 1-methylphosphonate 5-triphosphate diphosphatase